MGFKLQTIETIPTENFNIFLLSYIEWLLKRYDRYCAFDVYIFSSLLPNRYSVGNVSVKTYFLSTIIFFILSIINYRLKLPAKWPPYRLYRILIYRTI